MISTGKHITDQEASQVLDAVRAIIERTHGILDDLTRASVRAQGQGTEQKVAAYFGYDWQAIHAADWDAAILENEGRDGVIRLLFEDVAGAETIPTVDTSMGYDEEAVG